MKIANDWRSVLPPTPPSAVELEREAYLLQLLTQRRILAIEQRHGSRATPVVEGQRIYNATRTAVIAVEVRCSWCGDLHRHGAGPGLYEGDGHRLSHCTAREPINSGYVIRELPATSDEIAALAHHAAGSGARSA